MKRIATVLTLLLSLKQTYSQSNIDVTHYKFEIDLSDKSDTVKGKAFVTIKFIQAAQRFSLSLSSASKGNGMTAYLVNENVRAFP